MGPPHHFELRYEETMTKTALRDFATQVCLDTMMMMMMIDSKNHYS